jgi:hypothetical protein
MRFDAMEASEFRYTGNIVLTWEPETVRVTVQTNEGSEFQQQPVDFELRILDRRDGETVIGQSDIEQRSQSGIEAYEIVSLSDTDDFVLQVVNKNEGADNIPPVRMYIFAESLPLDDQSGSSVVSPADARYSFTVGAAVPGDNTIAQYSSFGVLGARGDYTKPDLSAVGEFALTNGQAFFGTSAAAPVTTAAAALVWQESGQPVIASVPSLLEAMVTGQGSPALGEGVLLLSPPRTERIFNERVSLEPPSPFLTWAREAIEQEVFSCPGSIPSRLQVGVDGYVNYNLGLSFRAGPSVNAAPLVEGARLQLGTPFQVVGGPECEAPFTWWEVELDDGSVGWLAEGADYYFIAPYNRVLAQLPGEYDAASCPNVPASNLEVGMDAIVSEPDAGFTMWRGAGFTDIIGVMPQGTEVYELGGPVCVDNSILRWYFRVDSGEWTDHETWMSEARPGRSYITPAE